jgi:ribosome maturation factor RimP
VRESALFYWSILSDMALISREAVISRVTEIAERVGRAEGIEIVEVEFAGAGKGRVLRIFIDKMPQGVSHADCEFISQNVGAILDEEDVIPGEAYQMEVSSPGVERKLVKPADYQRFSGQKIRLVLSEPVENQKYWEGILRGLDQDNTIALEPAEGRLIHIPLAGVRKANLKFEW